ncbi:hypothetical protein CHUAL_012756 [Chamberlinius hualienensis]
MATYFSEKDIEEFRDCFYLYARSGYIKNEKELQVIMRSLGVNPTVNEIEKYFKSKAGDNTPEVKQKLEKLREELRKKGVKIAEKEKSNVTELKINFADFLDIMHQHSKVEHVHGEILNGMLALDTGKRGTIPVNDFKYQLTRWGEPLDQREINRLFREANLPASGNVKYNDLLNLLCPPKPDY